MADYTQLKSILLDLQAHRQRQQTYPVEDRTQKRILVEDMFNHLDINGDGHLSSSELAQVVPVLRPQKYLEQGPADDKQCEQQKLH
ncbi:Follistatin-related protein 4 [Varanus komodoensis]|nr:Follistatin-related protein 4 [Varanus komodoensis]